MKKVFVYAIAGALLVSSCGSYTASGAYTGSTLGSILGSAIGGLSDGPRGSDWGSIIGMAGGAVVGAAIGSAADRAQEQRIENKRAEIRERIERKQNSDYGYGQGSSYGYGQGSNYGYNEGYNYGEQGSRESGYDPQNGGDDRIDLNIGGGSNGYNVAPATRHDSSSGRLEVRNVRFIDGNHNQMIDGNEVSKVVFEVINNTGKTLVDVRPSVVETTGARQIFISPDARVEQLRPGQGIRYTAMVKSGNRIRNGEACFQVQAVQGNGALASNVETVVVPMRR